VYEETKEEGDTVIINGNPADVASAYIAARSEIQTLLTKDGTGHSNRTYPTLANVLASVTDILIAHGLVVMQETTSNEFGVGVSTTLLHKSGSSIDFAPLTMQPADLKPQTVGSTITYARRYSLISALGLVGGKEDDDGAQGQYGAPSQAARPATKPVSNGHQDDELWDTPAAHGKAHDAATPAQVKRANTLGVKMYGTEAWQAKMPGIVEGASKGSASTLEALKDAEIDRVISGLEKRINERAAQLQAATN
jgi:hypothetical protein